MTITWAPQQVAAGRCGNQPVGLYVSCRRPLQVLPGCGLCETCPRTHGPAIPPGLKSSIGAVSEHIPGCLSSGCSERSGVGSTQRPRGLVSGRRRGLGRRDAETGRRWHRSQDRASPRSHRPGAVPGPSGRRQIDLSRQSHDRHDPRPAHHRLRPARPLRRRPTLHLPTAWLWQKAWEQLAAAASSHARVDSLAGTAGANRVRGAGLPDVALWAPALPEIRLAAPELGVVGLFFVRPPPSRRCRSLASRRLAWRERPSETA